ncbi:hypothetical protein HK413_02265 [Mucilaginibacter sp. S1162]|uniref:RND efflux pump membrane fusion protein barrel-sandwich domain-containing protein n=1 Tax=Mucilaginibacter humi TaxID=2732510 RepID=A0ABX1VZB3_9SPHI|nr:hypothetical protein [Mucilaginibacter humi]NNU33287.1 hypothetical protein [Mucilaginibacter humi]
MVALQKQKLSTENVRLMKKFHIRDSTLYKRKVITEAEMDKSDMNYLGIQDSYNSTLNDITNIREQIKESTNKIQQINIQKSQLQARARLNLITTYTELADSFKTWEQQYVFKAPISGRLQFSKFWTNNYFIQAGEPVFTVVPVKTKLSDK